MKYLLLFSLLVSSFVIADNNLGLPTLIIPLHNPQSAEKIELGRQIFNDPVFSLDGSTSCASCHQQSKAFTDGVQLAKGLKGLTGKRNSPTIVNAAFYQSFFHDGRASSLEDQALGPMLNPVEHGLKNKQDILDIVLNNDQYKKSIQQVFQIPVEQISTDHIAKAIASFERTLISGNTAFDQYFFAGKVGKLSESAARGSRVFRRKGNCANCHEISWNNALFSDNRFYNIGIGFNQLEPVLDNIIKATNEQYIKQLNLTDIQHSELGRFKFTKVISDIGKFRTPTIRNIALTAPYMHDGSIKTLAEVVEYYDKGGDKNRFIDPAIFPLHLTDQEKDDLVAFMQSLTSPQYIK